jgi:hypothetical protein
VEKNAMVEHSVTRRKALAGLASVTIGALGINQFSSSANAEITAEPTYSVADETTEITGELEAVRLGVDATITYQSEEEITTLGATLSVGPSDASELDTLDTSILQQSSQESAVEQSLTANLGEVVAVKNMAETTTEFQSELYVFIEASSQRVAEKTIEESFSVTLENGEVESSLGVQAEGTIQVSQSG